MAAISTPVRFSREAGFDLAVTAFQAAEFHRPAYFSNALFTGGAQRPSRAYLTEVDFVQ